MSALLFVYGTLKRRCCNHHQLAGQTFIGPARTPPGFRLHDLGGFPGITSAPADTSGVVGELWSVDDAALARLDAFEGVHEGLYHRGSIPLAAPFAHCMVEAYYPTTGLEGRSDLGSEWIE